jgi:hypothetical protein
MPYPIRCPLPGQTSPLPLTIDGTTEENTLGGDGARAPFFVFDQNNQENVRGPFRFRWLAVLSARRYARKHGLVLTD